MKSHRDTLKYTNGHNCISVNTMSQRNLVKSVNSSKNLINHRSLSNAKVFIEYIKKISVNQPFG